MSTEKNPLITNLEIALRYHNLGFSIFPLWKGTKGNPIVQWKKYISEKPTEDEIKNWWTKYPEANIAIVTGKISGIFVLDTEKDFDLNNIKIPNRTSTVITGRGGRHFYFKIPKDTEVDTHIEIWGKDPKNKADIKGNGGYVVAPPSFNAETKNYYEWVEDIAYIDFPPEWLLELIENINTEKSSIPFHEVAKGVSEGSRNVSATSFIGHVLLKTQIDMWEMVAWPAVLSWNSKNNPPLDETELRSTFDSIARREFNRQKGMVTKDDLASYDGPDKVISSHEMKNIINANKLEYKYKSILLAPLDRVCDGFVPGELIVISGPEKMGKTRLLQFLTVAFSQQSIPVLWFTYEMTPREFIDRYKNLPIFYLPMMNKSYDLKWLESRIIEAKKKYDIKVVMIDHLGFILDAAQQQNLAVQLGTVVRFLKSVAREQEIVIFLVHHMRRIEVDEQPSVRDLRDSALIAAEADSTVLIWRLPKPGQKKRKGESVEFGEESMIKVCNHRRTGVMEETFRLRFDKETGHYHEIGGSSNHKEVDIDDITKIMKG